MHNLNLHWINNTVNMRISSIEPLSIILSQTKDGKRLKCDAGMISKPIDIPSGILNTLISIIKPMLSYHTLWWHLIVGDRHNFTAQISIITSQDTDAGNVFTFLPFPISNPLISQKTDRFPIMHCFSGQYKLSQPVSGIDMESASAGS